MKCDLHCTVCHYLCLHPRVGERTPFSPPSCNHLYTCLSLRYQHTSLGWVPSWRWLKPDCVVSPSWSMRSCFSGCRRTPERALDSGVPFSHCYPGKFQSRKQIWNKSKECTIEFSLSPIRKKYPDVTFPRAMWDRAVATLFPARERGWPVKRARTCTCIGLRLSSCDQHNGSLAKTTHWTTDHN